MVQVHNAEYSNITQFTHSNINLLYSLSYDRSMAYSKANSVEYYLERLHSISSIFALPEVHTVAAYVFFLVFLSLL